MKAKPNEPPDRFTDGIVFNLGLFLSQEFHYRGILVDTEVWVMEDKSLFPEAMRKNKAKMKQEIESMACCRWINHAGHYVLNARTPSTLPKTVEKRMKDLQDKIHGWMYSAKRTQRLERKDIDWALAEAKEMLRGIDEHHGSNVK